MFHDPANWRMKARRTALALTTAALPFAVLGCPAVHAQGIMRSPSINIGSRMPSIEPSVTPRFNPNIAGTAVTGIGRTTPNFRTYRGCSYAYRASDAQCPDEPVTPSND